ncbi:MAG: YCF48-related protein [Pseudomonadota bacterium]
MNNWLLNTTLAAMLACALAPATAAFQDPLDTPAMVDTALAQASRMTAVARAGASLVAVGPRGHILLSKDQGASWKQVPVPVSSDLVAVRFLSASLGWAVGHDGVVLHSADGGATWQRQFDGRQAIQSLKPWYARQAAAGDGAAAAFLPDVDRYVEEGPGKPLLDVLFLDEKEGFVVGAFNLAFHTLDGGKSWAPLMGRTDNPKGLHLYTLAQAGGKLYAGGEQGLLLAWNAQQGRFEAMASPYRGSFFGLLAAGDGLLAYGLRGNAWYSADGGKHWIRQELGVTDAVTSAASLEGGSFVLVTQGGKIFTGQGQGKVAEVRAARPMAYFSVAAAGPRNVVVVGAGGVQAESLGTQR